MWKRNELPLLLYHVKRIECRSENHVPKAVPGLFLKVTKVLQWTKNENNYKCSQLGMKKTSTKSIRTDTSSVCNVKKKSEVDQKFPKSPRTSVFRGGFVRGDAGNYAVFTMQCASASHRRQEKS